ncbi:MAG: ribosome silencing factor [Kiritimatiellae bacterium]|nr:ribosome silencing factor [Kiritimatiellia bacterium]
MSETKDIVSAAIGALDGKKAENIRHYDVRGKSSVTDEIVVASATSAPHLRSLSVAVQRALRESCGEGARVSGDAESAWIVLDYVDVMIHLFLPEAREYYDIESLWG